MRSASITILNYHDWLDWVQFITNAKYDNDITSCIDATYVENDIELSWSIRLGADCDEN